MLIYADELISLLNKTSFIRVFHDHSVDSITTVSILSEYFQLQCTRSTVLQIMNDQIEEQLKKLQSQNHQHIIILINLGSSLDISQWLSQDQKLIMCTVHQPIALSNVFAHNVFIFDDNTSLLQFQQIFNPKHLKEDVDAFLNKANEDIQKLQLDIKQKSQVQAIQLRSQNMSAHNHLNQSQHSNIFSQVLTEIHESQSMFYQQRDERNQMKNNLRDKVQFEENQFQNEFESDKVDDLDEIDDAYEEDYEEEMENSLKNFINDQSESIQQIDINTQYKRSEIEKDNQEMSNTSIQSQTTHITIDNDTHLQGQSQDLNDVLAEENNKKNIQQQDIRLIQEQDLDLLKQLETGYSAGQNINNFLLEFQPSRYSEEELERNRQLIERLQNSEKCKQLISQYESMVTFGAPTSARVAELILVYSTVYDQNNRFFINKILFQAFTGVFYRLQLSQTNQLFVQKFYNQLKSFIETENNTNSLKYLDVDFNLPLFRLFTLKDSIMASPLQFCIPSIEHAKPQLYRTQFILTKLGVGLEASSKTYANLNKREREVFKKKYVGLKKRVIYNLFVPNLIYRFNNVEISAQDYVYLLEYQQQQFQFVNYRNLIQVINNNYQQLYQELKQQLHLYVQLYDKSNVYYKHNIAIFQSKLVLNVQQMTRLGSFVEQTTVLAKWPLSQTTSHSQLERTMRHQSRIINCPCFQQLKVKLKGYNYDEVLQNFTTLIFNEEQSLLKQNGCLWYGGYLASGFITGALKQCNQLITDKDTVTEMQAIVRSLLQ